MEVNGRRCSLHLVADIDDDDVVRAHTDGRTGQLSIDRHECPLYAVGCDALIAQAVRRVAFDAVPASAANCLVVFERELEVTEELRGRSTARSVAEVTGCEIKRGVWWRVVERGEEGRCGGRGGDFVTVLSMSYSQSRLPALKGRHTKPKIDSKLIKNIKSLISTTSLRSESNNKTEKTLA
jgi:hypothetical protein